MITISVHSYKGGTGRTLAVTQLAILLARFKKSVVVLDFDIESPGLAYRLQSVFPSLPRELGLVRHAEIFDQSGSFIDLAQYLQTLHHRLRLLTPGDPFGVRSGYWESLLRMTHFESDSAVSYFSRLKSEIAESVNPKPDYLLIDAPSGFSKLAGICNNLLADIVLTLTTAELDSLLGTNLAAVRKEERKYQGHRVPATYYAVCRYPASYEGDHGMVHLQPEQLSEVVDKARGTLIQGINQPIELQKVFLIRSEPRLQMGSVLAIPFEGEAMQSAVVHDYCDLFSEILPDLEEQFSALRSGVRVLRSYYLLEAAGQMINPADESLNVAFRVDTLLSFMDSLVSVLPEVSSVAEFPPDIVTESKHSEQTEDEAMGPRYNALFGAGYVAAKNFSEYLKNQWSRDFTGDASLLSIPAKVKKWCEFDSSVGFGHFYAYFSSEMAGEIVLNNSFLIAGRRTTDQNLCGFMAGYITRILEVLFARKPIKVTHDLKTDCGQFTEHDPPVCRFRFVASAGQDTAGVTG